MSCNTEHLLCGQTARPLNSPGRYALHWNKHSPTRLTHLLFVLQHHKQQVPGKQLISWTSCFISYSWEVTQKTCFNKKFFRLHKDFHPLWWPQITKCLGNSLNSFYTQFTGVQSREKHRGECCVLQKSWPTAAHIAVGGTDRIMNDLCKAAPRVRGKVGIKPASCSNLYKVLPTLHMKFWLINFHST